jgi:hypothetical protein
VLTQENRVISINILLHSLDAMSISLHSHEKFKIVTAQGNDSGPRFLGFPEGKLRKMVGSSNTVAGFLRLWLFLTGTERIQPLDMIIVLLLPPSYHFPEFSCQIRPVRFHLGAEKKRENSFCYLRETIRSSYHGFRQKLREKHLFKKRATQSLYDQSSH